MPETRLLRHSLLREEQTTPESLRTAAAAWRKRYPRRDGYQVRTFHRELTFAGHKIALVVIAVLEPVGKAGGEDDHRHDALPYLTGGPDA